MIGFLDFTFGASVFVFYLKRVKDILPYVQSSVCVSKGENNEFLVNTDDTLDVFSLFLNEMNMNRLIRGVTNFALPVVEILVIISTNN